MVPAACNPWDKAGKPLKRERMSSADGEIRGGQRTMLQETRKMNSVLFTGCCLLAIIVKHLRCTLYRSKSDTTSLQAGINTTEVNVRAVQLQPQPGRTRYSCLERERRVLFLLVFCSWRIVRHLEVHLYAAILFQAWTLPLTLSVT